MDTFFKIIVPLLTLLSGALYFIVKRKDDELNRVRQKVSDKKHDTYSQTIELYFDLLKDNKKLKSVDSSQLAQAYIDIKKNILLFASDDIIFKFFDFEKTSDPGQKIFKYCELIVLMRKDMGNDNTRLNARAMLRALLTDETEYQKFIATIYKISDTTKTDKNHLQKEWTQ